MPKGKVADMERVSVQLTSETKAQIIQWANEAGVKPGYFMSLALTIGARQLARNLHPEQFMTPDVWQQLAVGLGVDFGELKARAAEKDPELYRMMVTGEEKEE